MGKGDRRRRLLAEIEQHGPHLYVSYRGDQGKTTGYYVPKAAEEAIRAGGECWHQLQLRLKQLAELNKEQALGEARKARSAR